MLQSNLKYDDYAKINEIIEGYENIDRSTLALANRPLPTKTQCPCLKESRNDLNKVKPYYDNGQFHMSSNTSDKGIPVIIKKERDQYLVLENGVDDSVYSDSWADLPASNKENSKAVSTNWITRFYFGSLSVISLFIVYRMIQKTR